MPCLPLDTWLGALVREGDERVLALPRASGGSKHASIAALLKQGKDPWTGRRHLEEMILEMVFRRPLR